MLGRGTWNRTTVSGFGDLRTNRCTIPLRANCFTIVADAKRILKCLVVLLGSGGTAELLVGDWVGIARYRLVYECPLRLTANG